MLSAIENSAMEGRFRWIRPRFQCLSRDTLHGCGISRRHSAVFSPNSCASNHQIGQAKERANPCDLLGKPALANLLQTQVAIDDVKRMFDLGPDTRYVLLNPRQDWTQRRIGQFTAFTKVHRDMPARPFLVSPTAPLNTPATRIAKNISILTVHQLIR
jgi:hypothetical protein